MTFELRVPVQRSCNSNCAQGEEGAWERGYLVPIATLPFSLSQIGNPSAWGDYDNMNNPIYNLCHTCKAVRPVRAKHCRQCNRCVEVLDHHCPWIDNCIGRKNRFGRSFKVYNDR